MDEQQRVQAEVNARIAARIPTKAWESIVPIVVANPPSIHLLGTGSLCEIAGDSFVVTAAHIIEVAYEKGKTIGISDDGTSFIAVAVDWFVSAPVQQSGVEDPFDVAAYRLPQRAIDRLRASTFWAASGLDQKSAAVIFSSSFRSSALSLVSSKVAADVCGPRDQVLIRLRCFHAQSTLR